MLNVNEVCQVRVNSRNLGFTQTWENNAQSPCAKEKCNSLVLSRSDLWMVWRFFSILHVYCYYFYLEPMVTKDTWTRTTSVTVMIIFFEVAFWKSLDQSYVQIPFSTNTRHIDISALKDTQQFFILGMWINMRAKSFIKTLVNVTETRIDESAWKKIVTQNVHLDEHCTKIETMFHLFYALFFLTNLVFKFNIVLIGIFLDVNHNLLFCLLINIFYITDLDVYPVPYDFL